MGETNNKNLQLSYLKPPLNPQSHPWLIFCHGKHKQRQTFYSVSESRYYVKIIPELRNKRICCSCYGWLLLKDLDTHIYSFINPHSMEKIQLPQTSLRIKSYILLCPPDDPHRIFFFVSEDNLFLIWYGHIKIFMDFYIELEDENDEIGVAVPHGRYVYGLTHHGMKLVKMKNKPLSPIRFENSIIKESLLQYRRHFSLPFKTYMAISCNEIMVVVQTYSINGAILDFQIFRADFAKRTWEEVNNIGNRTIFLSSHGEYDKCCFIVEDGGKSGTKSNSIYFSELTSLYIYDLKDRSISMSRPCPAVSRYHSFQCWVEF